MRVENAFIPNMQREATINRENLLNLVAYNATTINVLSPISDMNMIL